MYHMISFWFQVDRELTEQGEKGGPKKVDIGDEKQLNVLEKRQELVKELRCSHRNEERKSRSKV